MDFLIFCRSDSVDLSIDIVANNIQLTYLWNSKDIR